MKTRNLLLIVVICFSLFQRTNAQITSVANGNWTNPLTWGGTIPTPGSDVIINHTVTLDMDWGYSSGSITINSAGALNGNTGMRALALIAGGNGTLTVSGSLNIARVALFSGSMTNNSTIQSDSLFNCVTFNNNTGATVNAAQFMNSTGGNLTNSGTIISANFLNIYTVTNNNSLSTNDFMNCKNFINAATGTINVTHDFLNSDSLASPKTFVNNGTVTVANDWLNTESVSGAGKFCIGQNTSNTGLMTGTFDFCDQTGGILDISTGTIQPTVTYCQYPCNVNINDADVKPEFSIYPNPGNGIFNVNATTNISKIEVYNIIGKIILTHEINSQNAVIDLKQQVAGIYFYKMYDGSKVLNTGKLIIK